MVRRPRRLAAVLALAGLVATVQPAVARADSVDEQRRKVQQIADELDRLASKVIELDDQYNSALQRQAELAVEITDLQARIDEQQGELDALQGTLTDIAIDKFTGGGTKELSPLFASPGTYNDAQQREQLRGLALDQGAGDTDDLQSLVDGLAKQRATLDRKTKEAADLVGYLETKRAETEQLEAEYQQRYTAAEAELGQLLAEEEARRAAAAAAEAARRAAQAAAANRPSPAPSRGGGNTGGTGATGGTTGNNSGGGSGNNSGGTSGGGSGGGSTPAPPPVSGKAGVAVAAAYSQLGVPYKYASAIPGVAFDCSGLTGWAWERAGVYLPHQSRQQYAVTPRVPKDQAQPGDLIFYYSPISHVGIYVGGGQLIHATRPGDVVKIAAVQWGKVVGVGRPG